MKTILAHIALWGLVLTIIAAVAIFLQPMIGERVSFQNLIICALISIAASGVWLIFNEQEKNERPK